MCRRARATTSGSREPQSARRGGDRPIDGPFRRSNSAWTHKPTHARASLEPRTDAQTHTRAHTRPRLAIEHPEERLQQRPREVEALLPVVIAVVLYASSSSSRSDVQTERAIAERRGVSGARGRSAGRRRAGWTRGDRRAAHARVVTECWLQSGGGGRCGLSLALFGRGRTVVSADPTLIVPRSLSHAILTGRPWGWRIPVSLTYGCCSKRGAWNARQAEGQRARGGRGSSRLLARPDEPRRYGRAST